MNDDQRKMLEEGCAQLESRAGLVWGPEYMEEFAAAIRAALGERDALAAEVAALKKAKTRRKVVQLIVLPKKDHYWNELYALADDGTIWQRYEPNGWSQTLDIPQSEQEAKR